MQLFFLFLILGFLNNEDEETIKKVNGICERECFEEFADIQRRDMYQEKVRGFYI